MVLIEAELIGYHHVTNSTGHRSHVLVRAVLPENMLIYGMCVDLESHSGIINMKQQQITDVRSDSHPDRDIAASYAASSTLPGFLPLDKVPGAIFGAVRDTYTASFTAALTATQQPIIFPLISVSDDERLSPDDLRPCRVFAMGHDLAGTVMPPSSEVLTWLTLMSTVAALPGAEAVHAVTLHMAGLALLAQRKYLAGSEMLAQFRDRLGRIDFYHPLYSDQDGLAVATQLLVVDAFANHSVAGRRETAEQTLVDLSSPGGAGTLPVALSRVARKVDSVPPFMRPSVATALLNVIERGVEQAPGDVAPTVIPTLSFIAECTAPTVDPRVRAAATRLVATLAGDVAPLLAGRLLVPTLSSTLRHPTLVDLTVATLTASSRVDLVAAFPTISPMLIDAITRLAESPSPFPEGPPELASLVAAVAGALDRVTTLDPVAATDFLHRIFDTALVAAVPAVPRAAVLDGLQCALFKDHAPPAMILDVTVRASRLLESVRDTVSAIMADAAVPDVPRAHGPISPASLGMMSARIKPVGPRVPRDFLTGSVGITEAGQKRLAAAVIWTDSLFNTFCRGLWTLTARGIDAPELVEAAVAVAVPVIDACLALPHPPNKGQHQQLLASHHVLVAATGAAPDLPPAIIEAIDRLQDGLIRWLPDATVDEPLLALAGTAPHLTLPRTRPALDALAADTTIRTSAWTAAVARVAEVCAAEHTLCAETMAWAGDVDPTNDPALDCLFIVLTRVDSGMTVVSGLTSRSAPAEPRPTKRERKRAEQARVTAAMTILTAYRGYKVRKAFLATRDAAMVCQRAARAAAVRRDFLAMVRAATIIQTAQRARSARVAYMNLRRAAVTLQSTRRMVGPRRAFLAIKEATTGLQSLRRGVIARRGVKARIEAQRGVYWGTLAGLWETHHVPVKHRATFIMGWDDTLSYLVKCRTEATETALSCGTAGAVGRERRGLYKSCRRHRQRNGQAGTVCRVFAAYGIDVSGKRRKRQLFGAVFVQEATPAFVDSARDRLFKGALEPSSVTARMLLLSAAFVLWSDLEGDIESALVDVEQPQLAGAGPV